MSITGTWDDPDHKAALTSSRTYANSASFPDPQDHPENGPITTIGYTPVSGDQPGRFSATTTPGQTAPGPIATAAANAANVSRPNPVTVAPSATQPRQQIGNADSAASRTYGEERGRGVVSNEPDLTAGITRSGSKFYGGGGGYKPPESGRTVEETNDLARGQLNTMRASEQQNRDTAQQRSGLVTSAIEARMDRDTAKREADVAGFAATNGAGVVLRGPTFEGRNPDAEAAARAAGAANGRLDQLTGIAAQRKTAADNAANPNYVQQAADLQRTQLEGQKGVREQQAGKLAQAQGQQALTAGGQTIQKGAQELQHGALGLQIQAHLTDLQKRASGTGPDAQAANNALALYQKAQSGKGGPITDEDILGAHKDMVVRAIQMGGPDVLKSLPSFQEYKSQLLGGGSSTPSPNHIANLKANPQTASDFDAKYGKGASQQYLGK